jgi:homoserine kinase type II
VESELVRVLDCYGLGRLRAAQRIERGFVDENWLVDTDHERYFLKRRHPRRRQPARVIRAQHDLIEHLREAGFPAPSIVHTIGGETFLIMDGEQYEIQDYIDGQPYNHGRKEHLQAAAGMLGQYHAHVEGFAPQALRERGPLYSPAKAGEILNCLREAWQLEGAPDLAQIARKLDTYAGYLVDRFSGHGALPHVVIHGDYYAGNLLFDGDRIIGVVDYDKANWQPRVAEMAEALIYFASPRPGHLKHLVYPGFLQWKPFARFLQGYAHLSTLSAGEIHALPDYICCIWFSVSLWRLLEKSPQRPPEAAEALQEVLALAEWGCTCTAEIMEVAHTAMRRQIS